MRPPGMAALSFLGAAAVRTHPFVSSASKPSSPGITGKDFHMARKHLLIALAIGILVILTNTRSFAATPAHRLHHQVIVPEEDRFFPFAITIHAGDSVKWTNMDTDDHTIVTNDF